MLDRAGTPPALLAAHERASRRPEVEAERARLAEMEAEWARLEEESATRPEPVRAAFARLRAEREQQLARADDEYVERMQDAALQYYGLVDADPAEYNEA